MGHHGVLNSDYDMDVLLLTMWALLCLSRWDLRACHLLLAVLATITIMCPLLYDGMCEHIGVFMTHDKRVTNGINGEGKGVGGIPFYSQCEGSDECVSVGGGGGGGLCGIC